MAHIGHQQTLGVDLLAMQYVLNNGFFERIDPCGSQPGGVSIDDQLQNSKLPIQKTRPSSLPLTALGAICSSARPSIPRSSARGTRARSLRKFTPELIESLEFKLAR